MAIDRMHHFVVRTIELMAESCFSWVNFHVTLLRLLFLGG